jgi:hypothetical protein
MLNLFHQEIEQDEALLGNLAVIFREASFPSEATECYISAMNNFPNDEVQNLDLWQRWSQSVAPLSPCSVFDR